MKKNLFAALLFSSFTFIYAQTPKVSVASVGVGAHLGVAGPDEFDIRSSVYTPVGYGVDPLLKPEVGFNVGVHLDVEFDLKKLGFLYYTPNIGIWFAGDDRGYQDLSVFEVYLDIGIFRYSPPFFNQVKPWIGLGPTFVIDRYAFQNRLFNYEYDDADPGLGFSFQTGVDFHLGGFMPFVKLEGKADSEGWGVVKFLLGGTIKVK